MQLTKFYTRSAFKLLTKPKFNFSSRFPINGEVDLASVQAAIQPPVDVAPLDLISKLSLLSPGTVYDKLDVFSRDLLLYLSDDLGWGMGAAIIAISMGVKLLFTPFMFQAQLNGIKMKLLEPETKIFQDNIQRLGQKQDIQGSRAMQLQYKELRQKHNISFLTPMFSLMQIPALMTWFFSLRYVASLPDKFPGILNEGFLWFKNLAEYDPYGLLPILSATLTYWNISLSPNMAAGQKHPLGRFYRYLRFLPFFSIPIVVFFPAAVNLYWCTSAFIQLFISASVRSEKIRSYYGVPQYLPGTILEKLHQKKTTNVIKAVVQEAQRPSKTIAEQLSNQQNPQQVAHAANVLNVAQQAQKSKETDNDNAHQKQSSAAAPQGSVKIYATKPKKIAKTSQ